MSCYGDNQIVPSTSDEEETHVNYSSKNILDLSELYPQQESRKSKDIYKDIVNLTSSQSVVESIIQRDDSITGVNLDCGFDLSQSISQPKEYYSDQSQPLNISQDNLSASSLSQGGLKGVNLFQKATEVYSPMQHVPSAFTKYKSRDSYSRQQSFFPSKVCDDPVMQDSSYFNYQNLQSSSNSISPQHKTPIATSDLIQGNKNPSQLFRASTFSQPEISSERDSYEKTSKTIDSCISLCGSDSYRTEYLSAASGKTLNPMSSKSDVLKTCTTPSQAFKPVFKKPTKYHPQQNDSPIKRQNKKSSFLLNQNKAESCTDAHMREIGNLYKEVVPFETTTNSTLDKDGPLSITSKLDQPDQISNGDYSNCKNKALFNSSEPSKSHQDCSTKESCSGVNTEEPNTTSQSELSSMSPLNSSDILSNIQTFDQKVNSTYAADQKKTTSKEKISNNEKVIKKSKTNKKNDKSTPIDSKSNFTEKCNSKKKEIASAKSLAASFKEKFSYLYSNSSSNEFLLPKEKSNLPTRTNLEIDEEPRQISSAKASLAPTTSEESQDINTLMKRKRKRNVQEYTEENSETVDKESYSNNENSHTEDIPERKRENKKGEGNKLNKRPQKIPSDAVQSRKKYLLSLEEKVYPLWVQCDLCNKWRMVSDVDDPSALPNTWTCLVNDDKEHNTCEAPQATADCDDEEDYMLNAFTLGSVVWVRSWMPCWWPAIVDIDPDVELFFWLPEYSNRPNYYHVTFFGPEVSRAWVKTKDLIKFESRVQAPSNWPKNKNVRLHKQWEESVLEAEEAKKLPLLTRRFKFSFAKRFKGPWFI